MDLEDLVKKAKEEKAKENQSSEKFETDNLWVLMLLSFLLFNGEKEENSKKGIQPIIVISMGDEK